MFFRTAVALLLSLTATVSAASTKPRRNLRVGLNTTGTIGTTSFFQLLRKVALKGGDEFDSPNTYQSRALQYVDDTLGLSLNDDDFVVYYALACLFYSTNAVHNKHTVSAFGLDFQLAGWTNTDGWLSVSTTAVNDQGVTVNVPVNKCNWHGITCDEQDRVVSVELFSNNLTGNFPPEIQHLGSTLQVIDVYDNQFLATEGDDGNDWMGKMPALRNLFFRSTSFEYHGIPTFWAGSTNLGECTHTCFHSLFVEMTLRLVHVLTHTLSPSFSFLSCLVLSCLVLSPLTLHHPLCRTNRPVQHLLHQRSHP